MERARIIVVIGSTIFALVKWEKIGGRKKIGGKRSSADPLWRDPMFGGNTPLFVKNRIGWDKKNS